MQGMKECLRCRSWFTGTLEACPHCHARVARRLTPNEEEDFLALKQLTIAMVTAWRENDYHTVIDLARDQCSDGEGTLELICMLVEGIRYMESVVANLLDVDPRDVHAQFAMHVGTGEL